jgi:hypothetical protein
MLKKVFLAVAVSFVMAGATMIAVPPPVEAGHGCYKRAQAKYAGHWKERRAYRKDCKAHFRAVEGNKKGILKGRLFKKAA